MWMDMSPSPTDMGSRTVSHTTMAPGPGLEGIVKPPAQPGARTGWRELSEAR